VNPWRLFKSSELSLANELVLQISDTLARFSTIDLNSISNSDKNVLLILSDNIVPYEWRKLWQGPKLASEFLKSVAVRVQNVSKFENYLDEEIQEIDFSKIFNVDSFLSTLKLIASRQLKVSTSSLVLESYTDSSRFEKMKEQVSITTVAPLMIDGLSFENSRLVQTEGAVKNFTSPIYLYFKEEIHNASNDEPNTFAMPLYATYSREKFLCTIKLSTSLDRDDIVYSGSSLIISGN
jgi:Dynein heavy chain C-terminal domain